MHSMMTLLQFDYIVNVYGAVITSEGFLLVASQTSSFPSFFILYN